MQAFADRAALNETIQTRCGRPDDDLGALEGSCLHQLSLIYTTAVAFFSKHAPHAYALSGVARMPLEAA